MRGVGPLWFATLATVLLAACTESVVVRTSPPGALVRINDVAIGTSPVLFTTPTKSLERSTFHYRVEADGYVPAEGELKERVSAGRIVGYVFTVGILRAFRGVKTFREPVEITLQPVGATAHAASTALEARLNELKSLHDRGVISDEEYRQARAAALKGP